MTHEHDPLSADGLQRRGTILRLAEQTLTDRMRQRRARRALRTALALVALAALLAPFAMDSRSSSPGPRESGEQSALAVQRLSDDELLTELASLGVSAGLVDVDGTTRVVTSDGSTLDVAVLNRPST